MSLSPYLEDLDSQIPAIQVLNALGWKYLSREEALKLRNGRLDQVVLTGVLKPWLERDNRIEVKGESHLFSEANIAEAIRRLLDEPYDELVRTNEKIHHLLTLGTSLDQTIEGDRKGRQLQYIDWKHPEANEFHVTDELAVERRRPHETCRPEWQEFELYLPKQPPRRYVSGETHRYLGRQYRLRVRKAPRRDVKLARGFLQVLTPAPQDSSNVRRLVTTWYRQHAERVFAERLAACRDQLKVDGVALPRLKVQQLAKRWGSCSPARKIILNVELLKAPKDCIDYVIAHELCHLRERNHSPRFWRLLDRLMPDWRERRTLLNQMADV